MDGAHILFAVLGAWRLTEVVTHDRVFSPFRKLILRLTGNAEGVSEFLSCPRCVSVWTGAAATLAFLTAPFLNWPFAFSFLYLVQKDLRTRFMKVPGPAPAPPLPPRPTFSKPAVR